MANSVLNGPLPSNLTLLSGLKDFAPNQKVRFLGCVTEYSKKTACLILEHNYPPGNTVQAIVDIRLLLQTTKSNETQIGEWVNVIGYVQASQPVKHLRLEVSSVNVQALVLWATGPLKLQVYERSLDQEKLVEDATHISR